MKYQSIQLLRYFAALLVVFTHATFYINSRMDSEFPILNFGAQGVNVFFVISGFVMIISSKALTDQRQSFAQFLASRLIRIVPLYWALNFLKIALLLIFPSLLFAQPTITNIISSLLFIPSKNAAGVIEAFYGVGWTLNFEMAFYLLFGLTMLMFRRRYWPILIIVLLSAAVLSRLVTQDQIALASLLDPIVLNFLWGIAIGYMCHKKIEMPRGISIAMIAFGLFELFVEPSYFLFELEYAFLVAGFIFLENSKKIYIPAHTIKGGDASYSLYLIHPMVGVFMTVILIKVGITEPFVALPIIMSVCIAISFATYKWIEQPITVRLRAVILDQKIVAAEAK